MSTKPIIYQLIPRLFANTCPNCVPNGTIEQNGAGKMNDISPKALKSIRDLGATHVWYTGVIEHAHCTDYSKHGIRPDCPYVVKGKAGSPYAIKDYYDIDPDIAVDVDKRMDEFERLVKRSHKAGLKVIIDFVPNHVARRYNSDAKPSGIEDFGAGDNPEMFFSPFNNFYYITRQQFSPPFYIGSGDDAYVEFPAKASGNDCYTAFPGENDWYETVKLNYGVDPANGSKHFDPIPPTWMKMLHILRYWASKGVDGFRCDMAHMVPLEFWHWAISNVKEKYPDIIFIAEIYDVRLYADFIKTGGFDYLYDKVNLYDSLRDIECHNHSSATLTSCWQTVEGLSDHMLNFLENHDEQRFASVQYAGDASKVIPSLVVSSMMSTGPFMLYMGQELGEPGADAEGFSGRDGRTTIFDYWSVSTIRRWFDCGECDTRLLTASEIALREDYKKILNLCNEEKAISEGKFFDVMYVNYNNHRFSPHRHYAFLRATDDEALIIAVNFDHDRASEVAINIPAHAFEFLNLPEGELEMTELLSGQTSKKTLDRDTPFTTYIPAPLNAVIWKVKIQPAKSTKQKSNS